MKVTADKELPPLTDRMSTAKQLLLERRMRGQLQTIRDEGRIQPRALGTHVPISAEQHRIWLHAVSHPDLPLYNEAITLHHYGDFDLTVFESVFNEILRRHEAWRTGFVETDGRLMQIIERDAQLHFSLSDLRSLPREEREAEALRQAAIDARTPIDLNKAPLMRGRVVRVSDDEHRIYLTLHHIIFDGVSIYRIFMPELATIYSAFVSGQPSPLRDPELQYGDYSLWREEHLASPSIARNLQYWQQQLSGNLPILTLPTDRARPLHLSHRGSMECFEIPTGLIELLRSLSQVHGVTLYMMLLAAFKVLLFRYSGQEDLIVGGAADARRRPELEGVMGYFLDTIPIRTHPTSGTRFSDFLIEVRDSVLGALSAADVPFDRIVEAVQPQRNSTYHPIFQAFFSIEPPAPSFGEGWDLTQMDLTVRASKFDLYLELDERPDAMAARFMYNTDIFDAATIRRMAAHWLVILRALPSMADKAIGLLPLLTAEETKSLCGSGGWNDTTADVPRNSLHALIDRQARKTPDAIAITFEGVSWSYTKLMDRADSLANELRKAGIKRGSLVAVLLPRTPDLIAGILAILRAGAAYLPIDPDAPRTRLALCLADAKPAAILTGRGIYETTENAPLVLTIEKLETTAHEGDGNSAQVDLDDLAYVIYTSGTTGKPKGVEISHRSIVNLLFSMRREPGFTEDDRLLAVTTIAFDIAALEIFLPLIAGGTVILSSRSRAQDPYLLAELIERSQCTVMQATPATWHALLATGWRGPGQRLKVLCGGESLSRELAERLLDLDVDLWNMYGPTETTIWSAVAHIETSDGSMSIGNPIANTTLYVLDAQRQLDPVGVPGRLYIGGVGLARGYRDQPIATADRFMHVEAVEGARLYDTGDLAVRRADGRLECLGRADNQVKVRGFRIELEAVETAVRRHPKVSTAAARVWPDSAGSMRLSVYVVGKEGPPPDPATLRRFLQADQPEFMIPSDFVAVDALPLSLNGKVDRTMLPPPIISDAPVEMREHRNDFESRLAKIWADILRVNSVYGQDNFFDLGGHSLLVATLRRKIESEFGHRLSMATLFHAPTLEQQSVLLEAADHSATVGLIALQPKGKRSALFWLHPPAYIGRLTDALGKDQPVMGVGLTEEDLAELGDDPRMEQIAARHVKTILAAQPDGPYLLGGLCTGGIVAFEVASQLRAAGHEVSLLVLLDAQNPFFYRRVGPWPVEVSKACFYLKQALLEARTNHRASLRHRFMRMINRRKQVWQPSMVETETVLGERMTDAAAYKYRPLDYDGDVLLMQPRSRPRRVDHSVGWRVVVRGTLISTTVDGHHDELLSGENVGSVAKVISEVLTERIGVAASV